MAGPAFDYFEVVTVLPCEAVPNWLWGTTGIILGKAENEVGDWEYAVRLCMDDEQCWQLLEKNLKSQEHFISRDEVYSGETIAVLPLAKE